MNEDTKALLAEYGITVYCESPLELGFDDGSIATGMAAQLIIRFAEDEASDAHV